MHTIRKAKQFWKNLLGSVNWQKLRGPAKWVIYVGIALIAVALESGGEFLRSIGISAPNNEEIAPSMVYQRFATVGYRKPRSHFVTIVVMSPTYDPQDVFGDICEKREFEAALLQKVMEFSPSVAVLDFWYSPQSCKIGEDAQRSSALKRAISEASNRFPVVVGLSSHTTHQFEIAKDPDLPGLKKLGFTHKDQVLDENARFGDDNVGYGLARLELDTRRIPVFWNVYPNKAAVGGKSGTQKLPSLAYTTATLRDSQLPDVLKKINDADEHPFTSFIPEAEFGPIRAIDILCGGAIRPEEDWRACKSIDVRRDPRFNRLKGGRIVLIAENSDQDQHKSVIGELPGYVLQANYIEALLDDRCFRPIPPLVGIGLTLLGITAIVTIFEKFSHSMVALLIAYLLVIMIAGLCNVGGMYFGRFIGFWIPLLSIPPVELLFTWRKQSAPKVVKDPMHMEPSEVR
jgi:hypothetical protein